MIKVLFESSIFLHQNVGGISKYISELNKNLFKNNISSKIFSPISINYYLDHKDNNSINYIKFSKIPKFCRKLFFFINNFLTYIYIKIYKPDILHFSYYNKPFLKYLRIPYVLTIYDLIYEKMKLPEKEFEKKELLNNAKHIICISEQTRRDLIRYYRLDKKKTSVVYLGTHDEKKKKTKKKLEKYILFVGSRKRYKNFVNFALAFSKSKFLIKNYKIICFGGGNFLKKEINNFENLGIKSNISYVKGDDLKLSNLYNKASLYVSLSIYEGFGLTLLEAMKSKCPVVCSNIPVFKEIYKNSCEYVNSKNINDIKKGIERVLKSKKKQKRLILNSKKIVKRFTWELCAFKTAQIYKNICNYEK